jgi:leucine dehydrogenase
MGELFPGTEQLVLCHDREVGLRAVIAIDDTTRGPGMGGVRWKSYPTEQAAVTECRRLAAAMTFKHAAADLPFGGAKAVILRDGTPADPGATIDAFATFVARLDGAYIPGVDMGTTVADLARMALIAPDVACHEEDPAPWTALGVFAGLRAAVTHVDARDDLDGVRVAIQGAGNVGAALARLLADEGARLLIADVDERRAAAVAAEVGGEVVDVATVAETECDVFAPCAVARVVDEHSVGRLRCRIVAGAANDVLASPELADDLAARGIVFVPDFLLNAGGVVHVQALRAPWSSDELRDRVLAIGDRVRDVLVESERDAVTPLVAAEALAHRRLGRG